MGCRRAALDLPHAVGLYVPVAMPARPRRRVRRPRDQTMRETRDALLEAGLAEFAEHGLDAPSLDGICARAGYTRGAFYVHFRDRDDFVVAVAEHVLGRLFDAVIATGDQAHDLERSIERFMAALAASATNSPRPRRAGPLGGLQFHRLLEACARSATIRTRVIGLVQEAVGRLSQATAAGQAVHTVRADVDARQVATVLVGAAIGLLAVVEMGMPIDFESGRAILVTLLGTTRHGSAR
jgi:TetR/AcrR family transcriptional regulator, transcriptional repressor for nem operon